MRSDFSPASRSNIGLGLSWDPSKTDSFDPIRLSQMSTAYDPFEKYGNTDKKNKESQSESYSYGYWRAS